MAFDITIEQAQRFMDLDGRRGNPFLVKTDAGYDVMAEAIARRLVPDELRIIDAKGVDAIGGSWREGDVKITRVMLDDIVGVFERGGPAGIRDLIVSQNRV